MDTFIEFKDILRDYLIEHDMTQVAFACRVGIKQSQVSEWLHGKAKPGYDMLRQLSLALDISADYFLGLTNR